jgi:ABC-type dipeptide/oligopeptide/nickel transport system ATPase component
MRRRIVIAMALMLQPSLIIADEPTTALDVTTQKEIFNPIEQLERDLSISFVVISHNLNLIGERWDRVYVLYAGHIVESGPSERILEQPLHPYARGLLASIPRLDASQSSLRAIPGEVQDLTNLPNGCFLAPLLFSNQH